MNRIISCIMVSILIGGVVLGCQSKRKDLAMLEKEAQAMIDEYVSKYEPLDLALREAWYEYDTTGNKEASKRQAEYELAIRNLNSDTDRFAKLKRLYKVRKDIKDDLLRRQVEILYLRHLPNQVTPDKLKKLTELEQKLKEAFNDYQPNVDGKTLTPVEVTHILADSTDSAMLGKVWKAQKAIGPILERDYRDLVKLRNEIARDLGYGNALALDAEINEMDLDMLAKFYRDVKEATDEPFKKLKNEYIDPKLAQRYKLSVDELQPWHYQNAYFQEAPTGIFGEVDLDQLYEKVDSNDAIKVTEDFYASMGVDVKGIIKRSSLFPKPGKNPHAVAWYLNPNKPDTSVLIMNLPESPKHPKATEISTLVHELGHDINYEAILRNKEMPYLLREPTMLTEAFAMLMEQQTLKSDWFKQLGIDDEKAKATQKAVELIDYVDQLIFLRWASTIYCFETNFYSNPDQDIGDLWWQCKEKHQLLKRPKDWKGPDALAKYHIPNVTPLYYSNYAIGRVVNVQFADLFAKKIGEDMKGASYLGKKQLGSWLMDDFLAQGERYSWSDFLKRSTGKELSVEAWKKYYVDSDFDDRLFKQ